MARWSRELANRSQLSFQTYYDRSTREQKDFLGRLAVDILDFDFQHRFGLGGGTTSSGERAIGWCTTTSRARCRSPSTRRAGRPTS